MIIADIRINMDFFQGFLLLLLLPSPDKEKNDIKSFLFEPLFF